MSSESQDALFFSLSKELRLQELYLDKNGDVGVSFRLGGPLERFPEASRGSKSQPIRLRGASGRLFL